LAESSPAWQIEALKFDRRLHISLPAHLLDDDFARLWFRTRAGDQINHVTLGQQFPITQPSDLVFWRDRWYNVYLNYGDDGRLSHFYCNVGLPPEVSGQTLRFVDLDLDVRIGLDGQVRVLDADEFAEHTTCSAIRRTFNRPRAGPWTTSWPTGGRAARRSTVAAPVSSRPAGRPARPPGCHAGRDRFPTDK